MSELIPHHSPTAGSPRRGKQAAVCNRLHAPVTLARAEIPSVYVGTDTRLPMVAAIRLPCRYVKGASVGQLEVEVETLLRNRTAERERLIALRESTWNRYVREVTSAIAT